MPSPKRGVDSPQGSHGWGNFPAGLRVMVVDDDHLCLKVVAKMLKQCSYSVATCSSSSQALTTLREKPDEFDLVLSDVVMPDIDGFKLLEIIGLEMDIPVIMMSSNGDTETVLQGVTHGAVDFLIKPVRTEELRNIWQHVLRKQKEQAGKGTDDKSEDNGGGGEADHSSPETRKRAKDGRWELEDAGQQSLKRPRVHWSAEMHAQFVYAVNSLGIEKAVPKKILELMNVEGLTRENVASHLQKYRLYLKKTAQINDDNGASFMKMSSAPPAPVVHVDTARPNSFPWETPAVNSTTTHQAQSNSTPGFLPSMPFMPGVPFMGQARPAMMVPQLQAAPVASQQVPATVVPFIPSFIPMQPGVQQPHMAAAPGAAMEPHAWQQQTHLRPAPQPAALQFVNAPAMVPGGVVMDGTGFPSMDANFPGMEASQVPQMGATEAPGAAGGASGNLPQANGNRSVVQALMAPAPDPSGLMGGASGSDPGASQAPKRDSMDIHFSRGFLDDLNDGALLEGSELAMQPDPAMDDFLNFLAKDEPDL